MPTPVSEINRKAYEANYGGPVGWTSMYLNETGGECNVVVKPDIINILKTEQTMGSWCYGPTLNKAVWDALKKYKRGTVCADIGCGNNSPYPSFLIAAGYPLVTTYDVRFPTKWDKQIIPRRMDLADSTLNIREELDLAISISCIEHVGLGRYGDKLDPDGDIKMVQNIRKLLRPGGILIFAVPLGRAEVCWNAHRCYNDYRLGKLLEGFKKIDELGEVRMKKHSNHVTQPVVVAQKIS